MNNTENLLSKKNWDDERCLTPFLADRLIDGTLLIVLGAGVSRFYGMPNWEELLNALNNDGDRHDVVKGTLSFPAWAEEIQHKIFPNDREGFQKAISGSLYSPDMDDNFDFSKIADDQSLRALGALCHGSKRGNVSKVITLNYDCLLEAYFHYHGLMTQTIHSEAFSERSADVHIFHPHGYIPHVRFSNERSSDVVITRQDYERASESKWESTLLHLLSTHFVLFVGLSGEDDRLSKLAAKAKGNNPYVINDELPFFGVRICSKDKPMKEQWEDRGVFCKEVDSLDISIPEVLFSIGRMAAELTIG